MGGRRRLILLPERDWLLARLSAAPDLTVRALRWELIERGVDCLMIQKLKAAYI
jgi:hypothetical protein